MVAIIDSGSTKSDWVILDEFRNIFLNTHTIGFNPNFISKNSIATEIEKNQSLMLLKNTITKIFFYGAGCGVQKNRDLIAREMRAVFGNDVETVVREDLIAAAYAAYRGTPAMVCILGTGSNSCYFDGKEISIQLPSLGFLIGDEGSGGAIGKQLVRRYFMKKLPADLQQEFEAEYHLSVEEALHQMYHQPRPNAFLASFNRFVTDRISHPYFVEMVSAEMRNFFEYQVLPYTQSRTSEINFIGSVAYFYENILRSVAQEFQLRVGHIVQKPIESLVDYHIRYLL